MILHRFFAEFIHLELEIFVSMSSKDLFDMTVVE